MEDASALPAGGRNARRLRGGSRLPCGVPAALRRSCGDLWGRGVDPETSPLLTKSLWNTRGKMTGHPGNGFPFCRDDCRMHILRYRVYETVFTVLSKLIGQHLNSFRVACFAFGFPHPRRRFKKTAEEASAIAKQRAFRCFRPPFRRFPAGGGFPPSNGGGNSFGQPPMAPQGSGSPDLREDTAWRHWP